jgi:CRP/FNR family cyclic AMP-dependent transcriptional regulator
LSHGGATGSGKPINRHNSGFVATRPVVVRSALARAGVGGPFDEASKEGDCKMSMLSNLDLIRRVPLFSMLTVEQAQAIADSVVKRRFRRGELVVEQARKSNALFILLNGRARVLTSDSRGREVILAVLEAGDYVGEMSLIDNESHSATVRCEVQTDMLILGRADFARCLPENSTLSYAILRGLVRRLRHADRQIESLALLDVYGRVARTLLEMAEEVDGIKIIRNKVSRQDMAKVVGASREMVSRVMKDLEERGVIETQENGSVVLKERLHSE